jgi:hypothetical protein
MNLRSDAWASWTGRLPRASRVRGEFPWRLFHCRTNNALAPTRLLPLRVVGATRPRSFRRAFSGGRCSAWTASWPIFRFGRGKPADCTYPGGISIEPFRLARQSRPPAIARSCFDMVQGEARICPRLKFTIIAYGLAARMMVSAVSSADRALLVRRPAEKAGRLAGGNATTGSYPITKPLRWPRFCSDLELNATHTFKTARAESLPTNTLAPSYRRYGFPKVAACISVILGAARLRHDLHAGDAETRPPLPAIGTAVHVHSFRSSTRTVTSSPEMDCASIRM